MKITYQVDDGYSGKSRPQRVTIDDQEIIDAGSVEDAVDIVYDAVQDHFERNVSPSYDMAGIRIDIELLLKAANPE